MIEKNSIKKLLLPYVGLPIECDGMTRVLSYILTKNSIKHWVCIGALHHKEQIIFHWWIELDSETLIDYRAQMWLGGEAPHGIFSPKDYPNFEYEVIEEHDDFVVDDMMFQILTTL